MADTVEPVLKPADELRAAAAKLREMASAAAKGADGPWSTERYWWKTRSDAMPDQWMCAVTDEYGHVATSSEIDDDADGSSAADRVAWIALMGPDKADGLADLLDEAGDLARFAYVMEGSHAKESSLSILERTALKLARSILGQGQS